MYTTLQRGVTDEDSTREDAGTAGVNTDDSFCRLDYLGYGRGSYMVIGGTPAEASPPGARGSGGPAHSAPSPACVAAATSLGRWAHGDYDNADANGGDMDYDNAAANGGGGRAAELEGSTALLPCDGAGRW